MRGVAAAEQLPQAGDERGAAMPSPLLRAQRLRLADAPAVSLIYRAVFTEGAAIRVEDSRRRGVHA